MRRERILLARIPQAGHQEHRGVTSSCPFRRRRRASSSFLPFLMTSGSEPGAAQRASAAGATSSARSVTTCAITVSGALVSFIEPPKATSLARLLCPIISSVTSMTKCSGMSSGRHSISTGARNDFEQSALHLDAFRLAVVETGMETRMRLVRSMRLKSACSRCPGWDRPGDRPPSRGWFRRP